MQFLLISTAKVRSTGCNRVAILISENQRYLQFKRNIAAGITDTHIFQAVQMIHINLISKVLTYQAYRCHALSLNQNIKIL